jgi:hypothetical protein
VINGGLVAVRRRLSVGLGVGELVHRVLDRSRGRRRVGDLERVGVEDVLGAAPRELLRVDVAPAGMLELLFG